MSTTVRIIITQKHKIEFQPYKCATQQELKRTSMAGNKKDNQ